MQTAVPLACFLSVIRPPGVQYENSLLQIAPVDKSKCPYMKDGNDVAFQLFTRHNPTVFQDLKVGDDEKLFASNMDFHDKTVLYFHAWMETPEDGSGIMVREAYMQRGDTNVIMVDARSLQAGPWYFTAAQNTWYIGRFAGQFIEYLVTRGLNLNNTHLVGHSLGAHVAGVAGSALKSGKVARITGLDAALPLFDNLPLHQRLDPSDAMFVDTIHTDAGIFGYKAPIGHVDFYPNAGISPQPGCELEVVIPKQMLLNKCDSRTQTNGFYTYYLRDKRETTLNRNSLEYKLEKLFAFIQAVRARNSRNDSQVTLDKVKANILSLNNFKDGVVDYLNYDDDEIKPAYISKINKEINPDETYKMKKIDINNDKESEDIIDDNVEVHKTVDGNNYPVTDQIAEESDVYTRAETDKLKKNSENKTDLMKNKNVRRKRETASNKNNESVELNVVSGNLTVRKDEGIKDQNNIKNNETGVAHEKTYVNIDDIVVRQSERDVKPTVDKHINSSDDEFEISLDEVTETTKNKKESMPFKFNLFRRRPILGQIIRIIPRLNKKDRSNNKRSKFGLLKNKASEKNIKTKIGSKWNSKFERHLLKRQKRFLPFFKQSEDSNSILFKMLDFLIKNRKNVLPVFTVMREINTLVKSANGELNHISKESNNYIGATPPVFTPITYTLELGNENRVTAFVKKLFGIIPKGDRLTVGNGK